MYEKIFVMEVVMGKKIVVVNAGPRMGWNTETLISEAAIQKLLFQKRQKGPSQQGLK